MSRICLVSPFHVSFHPRLLREADSLQEAGHQVRVVCRQTDAVLVERDRRTMEKREWRLQSLDLCKDRGGRNLWVIESIRSKFADGLFRVGLGNTRLGIRGYVKGLGRLVELAASEPADWFIAHTQPALPVAAAAARQWKAQLGFDCEDLLAEVDDRANLVRSIERDLLPQCDYVSTASECMARKLVDDYQIPAPLVLHNVFSRGLARGLIPPEERLPSSKLRLHWFGQTIGIGRGIEEALDAISMVGEQVELHLRGRISDDYRSLLQTLANRRGVAKQLFFHDQVDHENLIREMDVFDVGLALERPENANYSRTVTNKVFSYLLAGLAIAATDTPGQREILDQIPSAGFVYPAHNPRALADALQVWLVDHNALRAAQQAAWDVARQRFCWDVEKDKFLNALQSASGQLTEQPAYG